MAAPTLLAGLDLTAPALPGAELLVQPEPLAPLPNPLEAMRQALEQPLGGASLGDRVRPRDRVLVVVQPPAQLAPMGELNPLRLGLRAVLELLRRRGLPQRNVRLLVANGLGHRPPMTELARTLGVEVTGAYEVATFDAEAPRAFRSFGEPQLAMALGEADLVIDLAVHARAERPPLVNLVEGLGSYESLRATHSPGLNALDQAGKVIARAKTVAAALPLFSLAVVENGAVLAPRLRALLAGRGIASAARTWNRLPQPVRRRVMARFRTAAAPCAVFAGEPFAVAEQANAQVRRDSAIAEGTRADVLVIGVPDLSPDAPTARSNPVLAAHLGLTTLLARARHRLSDAGAVVLVNPLEDRFDRALHLPFVEFYERALRVARTGPELAARFELDFSGRPELVAAYRKKGAVHGAHPFHRWYELEAARRGLRIFAAGAGAAAAQRVGIEPAESTEAAIAQAAEALGLERPRVAVLDLLGLT